MASKAIVQKFDRINKATLRLRGRRTRTGADATRNRQRAHGRNYKHRG